MKLMLVLLSVALGFSSTARAGAYTCAFEKNQIAVKKCTINSASPSTAKCSYLFPGTNLTGTCVITRSESKDLLACQIGVADKPDLSRLFKSKKTADAITALAQLPGFAAAAATLAPTNKATIHLGYVEKQGAPLFSAICPSTFGK
jgi:hypothetical protein